MEKTLFCSTIIDKFDRVVTMSDENVTRLSTTSSVSKGYVPFLVFMSVKNPLFTLATRRSILFPKRRFFLALITRTVLFQVVTKCRAMYFFCRGIAAERVFHLSETQHIVGYLGQAARLSFSVCLMWKLGDSYL